MLEDDIIGHCNKNSLYEHLLYNSGWFEGYKYKSIIHGNKESNFLLFFNCNLNLTCRHRASSI